MLVSWEPSRYKLDLRGVQEVRWDGSGTESAREYILFLWKVNEKHELGTGLLVHNKILLAVKRVEFFYDRISYIILRGRWFHIIFLNVHASADDKIDEVKDRF
jgi:hypothetical protein